MSSRVQLSKRLLLINSASSVLRRILYASVLIWVNQYLLRRIGPDEYSIYPLVVGVMVFIPLFSLFLTAGLGRFVTEAYMLGDDEKVTSIVSTMSVLLLVLALLWLTGGLIFAWHIGDVLTIPRQRLWDARIMFGLLVCCAAMRLPLTPFGFGLYVRQKFVLQNLIGVGVEIVKISLLFALLFGVSTRVLWLVVSEVVAQLLSSVIMVAVSVRYVPALRFSVRRINWGIARQIIGFGGWSVVINSMVSAQRMVDPLFLDKMAMLSDVTSYHIAMMPGRHIHAFAAVAMAPLLPQLITMHATGRHEQMRRVYLRGGRYGFWVILCISMPAIVYCRELITLYLGAQYIETAFVMVLVLIGVTWRFSNWMLPQLCQAKNQMRPIAIRFAFLQVVRVGLILYFVGWLDMGALGLGAAGLITAVADSVVNLPLAWRLVRIRASDWFREVMVKGLFPGAVAMLVWVGLEILRPPSTWVALGLYISGGLAVYLAVLVLFSFDTYDRTQIREVINSVLRGCRMLQAKQSRLFMTSGRPDSD